jgi:hypothetical protein
MTQDPIHNFVLAAERFRDWMEGVPVGDLADFQEGASALAALYSGLLRLPDLNPEGELHDPIWDRARIQPRLDSLPFKYYGKVYDPHVVPPEEPVTGSLHGDLADVYLQVIPLLDDFHAGRRDEAVWSWRFSGYTHWGAHATGALGAMHWWLAEKMYP